ncbi:MAG: hypothetical protein AAFY60_15455, partial [Myxococcota bacterium]
FAPATAVAYPRHLARYLDLEGFVLARFARESSSVHLVAESFSGPLAVRIASHHPERVASLTLVSTFLARPTYAPIASLAKLGFRLPPIAPGLRLLLLDRKTPDGLVQELQEAISETPTSVLRRRLSEAMAVDVTREFVGLKAPVCWLEPTRDRVMRSSLAQALQLQPSLRLHRVRGPHLLLQCRTDECATLIRNFQTAT